ncbi:hypothetical protein A2U01_0006721, partial [Trifolium medium]|nr:hypothetical protein [Trifolium medium]
DPLSPSETDAVHEDANAVGDEVEDTMMIRPTDHVIVTARSENDEHGLIEVTKLFLVK